MEACYVSDFKYKTVTSESNNSAHEDLQVEFIALERLLIINCD